METVKQAWARADDSDAILEREMAAYIGRLRETGKVAKAEAEAVWLRKHQEQTARIIAGRINY